jgi:hypothetical protein
MLLYPPHNRRIIALEIHNQFVLLVADGWCWFVLREKYCWLVADGWFVLKEKYCWLVLTQKVHLAPNTQQAEQAGFTRAESHETCQSIFPEN